MGRIFDALRPDAAEVETEAAMAELIAEAEAHAFCQQTLLMLAVNYRDDAKRETGARARALRWAAAAIRAQTA